MPKTKIRQDQTRNEYPFAIMNDFDDDLMDYAEALKDAFDQWWKSSGIRGAIKRELTLDAPDPFESAFDHLEQNLAIYKKEGVRADVNKMARVVTTKVHSDLQAEISNVIGYDPMLRNKKSQQLAKKTIREATSYIKSIPDEYHREVQRTVYDGIRNGLSFDEIATNLDDVYATKVASRTRTIAMDQVGNLYGAVTKAQHQSLGLKRFEWLAVIDKRTRDRHIRFNGETFTWENGASGEYPGSAINCFSLDTEVMTDQGFKLFKDLDGSEKILSMNPDTREIEYLKPDKYIKYKYNGDLIHIQSNTTDLMVTPDHRMPYISKWKYEEKYKNKDEPLPLEIKPAHDMKKGDSLPRGGEWSGVDKDKIDIDLGKDGLFETFYSFPIEDYVKFMAWYLSEGSTTDTTGYQKGHDYEIKITQHDSDNHKEIAEICNRLFDTVWDGKGAIYVIDDKFAKYLSQFGKSWEKFIPKNIKELDSKYLKLFLDAYLKGDGSCQSPDGLAKHGSDRIQYFTSSYRMASDLAELILKTGKAVSVIAPKESEYGKASFDNGDYEIKHPTYKVFENQQQYARFRHKHQEKTRYNDYVYDVELPRNHILYVKRNNKSLWSGNCRCSAGTVRQEVMEVLG